MRMHAFAVLITVAAMVPAASAQSAVPCQSFEEKLIVQKQVLAAAQKSHDRAAQAAALLAIGKLEDKDGQTARAINSFLQAQALEKIIGNRAGEAIAMARRANVYRIHGKQMQALALVNTALPIARASQDLAAIGTVLSVTGVVHSDRGDKKTSIDMFEQALPMCSKAHDVECELDTLNHIAWDYDELGQKDDALAYYNQALDISNSIGDINRQASFLNNIAWTYQSIGRDRDALANLQKSLPLARAACDLTLIGDTLGSIGVVYSHLGDAKNELENSRQSFLEEQLSGNRDGQAYALWGMGDASARLHDAAGVLRYQLAARAMAKQQQDLNLLGNVDTALMLFYRDNKQQQRAIYFGTDAVNSFQKIRKNIAGMDPDIQSGFAQSKSQTYRQLAELLVENDRLSEAEHVLDLLKEQEFNEVVRGGVDTAETKVEPLKLNVSQIKAQNDLSSPEKTATTLTSLSLEYEALANKDTRTAAEDARMQALDAQIEAGNKEMDAFLEKTFYEPSVQKAGTQLGNIEVHDIKENIGQLQNALDVLGPAVLGVQMLFGDEHVYALVVTAHSTEKYELPVQPTELRVKILQVRDELRHPSTDATADLKDLYRDLVAPWSKALNDFSDRTVKLHQTPTLLWSLDGVLRYLPMAALNDGQQYMVERFNNVLFTTQSAAYMQSPPVAGKPAFHALAMGLTKSYGGLPQLPGVQPELMSVVHDDGVPGSDGPMEGKLVLDDQFTLAAMKSQLTRGGKYTIVHIASHFVEQAGNGVEPYLMLGGDTAGSTAGYELTLSSLQNSPMRFNGIKLLTLSACSTAKGDAAQNGMEMDSLGMTVQHKGAEAVLATLWDVNDASTSRLMSEFYTQWVNAPADGKAEALRKIQMEFLHGTSAPTTTVATTKRSLISDDDNAKPVNTAFVGYSHPYYWAPFVLIGNYR